MAAVAPEEPGAWLPSAGRTQARRPGPESGFRFPPAEEAVWLQFGRRETPARCAAMDEYRRARRRTARHHVGPDGIIPPDHDVSCAIRHAMRGRHAGKTNFQGHRLDQHAVAGIVGIAGNDGIDSLRQRSAIPSRHVQATVVVPSQGLGHAILIHGVAANRQTLRAESMRDGAQNCRAAIDPVVNRDRQQLEHLTVGQPAAQRVEDPSFSTNARYRRIA